MFALSSLSVLVTEKMCNHLLDECKFFFLCCRVIIKLLETVLLVHLTDALHFENLALSKFPLEING